MKAGKYAYNNACNISIIHLDFSVKKTARKSIVYLGDQIEFIITVKNTGDCKLEKVFVIEYSYDGLVYDSFTGDKWIKQENTFIYNDTLDVGQITSFIVKFNTTKSGMLTNTIIAGANITPNKTSNSTFEVIKENKTDPENKSEYYTTKDIDLSENTGNPIFALFEILLLIPPRRFKR